MGIDETTLDTTAGALFAGVIISSMLYGVLSIQVYFYVGRFREDPKIIKGMVAALWIINGVHLIFMSTTLYRYIITHYGDGYYLSTTDWTVTFALCLEPACVYIEHLYFARRTWLLNGKRQLWPSLVILGLGSLSFAFGLYSTSFKQYFWVEFKPYKWAVGLWAGFMTAADLFVTISVALTLSWSKTGFHDTDQLLGKLIVWGVSSGALLAVSAIIGLMSFIVLNHTLAYIAAGQIITRIVAITVLASLNRRARILEKHRDLVWTTDTAIRMKSIGRQPRSFNQSSGGIAVQTVVVSDLQSKEL